MHRKISLEEIGASPIENVRRAVSQYIRRFIRSASVGTREAEKEEAAPSSSATWACFHERLLVRTWRRTRGRRGNYASNRAVFTGRQLGFLFDRTNEAGVNESPIQTLFRRPSDGLAGTVSLISANLPAINRNRVTPVGVDASPCRFFDSPCVVMESLR